MSAWQAGAFAAHTQYGPIQVAGWLFDHFALDFRVWEDWDNGCERGWVLTHVPTGRKIAGIHGSLADAQKIAERFAALGDWSFTDAAAAKEVVGKGALALKKELGGELFEDEPTYGPLIGLGLEAKEAA